MIAYVFGNGASIPYGTPLGSDLFPKALEMYYGDWKAANLKNRYHNLKRRLRPFFSATDDLAEHNITVDSIHNLHRGRYRGLFESLPIRSSDSQKGEEIFRLLSNYLSGCLIWALFPKILVCYADNEKHGYRTIERKRDQLLDGNGNLYDSIADFTFFVVYFSLQASHSQPPYYDGFASSLIDSPDDSILINLNYDTLLEKALRKQRGLTIDFRFGNDVSVYQHQSLENKGGRSITIHKPHGSFDFFFCPRCESLTISENADIESTRDFSETRTCKNKSCGKKRLSNYFIPYTRVDLPIRYRPVLNSILESLKRDLSGVSTVVTIGYSFSEHREELIDKHLEFIFKDRDVIVVARNSRESKRICTRLTRFGINAIYSDCNGFRDFVNKMKDGDFLT